MTAPVRSCIPASLIGHFVDAATLERLKSEVAEAKRVLPEDDLVFLKPNVASERLRLVSRAVSDFLHAHRSANLSELCVQLVHLERSEMFLTPAFEHTFSTKGFGDLSFYESYGAPWDSRFRAWLPR
jgi:hypothetical protein